MSTFEERIAKAVADKLNDGTVEELVSNAVTKALKSSIEEQFGWNGDARKIIDEKVKEAIVPAIERSNLPDSVVKLDTVLTEIVNSTALVDNKELLENFKTLMIEPKKKRIRLEDIFEKYKKYVSKNVDTSDLEIDYDDSPTYQNVTACVETIYRDTWNEAHKYCELIFKCVEDEGLEKSIKLIKCYDGEYRIIGVDRVVDINSLRSVSDFEILLMSLDRSRCAIVEISDIEDDEVEVEAEPEASWN